MKRKTSASSTDVGDAHDAASSEASPKKAKSTEATATNTSSSDGPCVCDLCGKTFSRLGNLNSHRKLHSDERPFVCTFAGCAASFKEKSHLTKHNRIHTDERPYACEVPDCGMRYFCHVDPSFFFLTIDRMHFLAFAIILIAFHDIDRICTSNCISNLNIATSPASPARQIHPPDSASPAT